MVGTVRQDKQLFPNEFLASKKKLKLHDNYDSCLSFLLLKASLASKAQEEESHLALVYAPPIRGSSPEIEESRISPWATTPPRVSGHDKPAAADTATEAKKSVLQVL